MNNDKAEGADRAESPGMSDLSIAAVETLYNGTKYRSRLEARYAVLFDVLGLNFQYEPEKFDTPVGRYIPDFWLPDLGGLAFGDIRPRGAFIEVKGPEPDAQALAKAEAVTDRCGRELFFVGPDIGRTWVFKGFIGQCPLCGACGFSTVFEDEVECAPEYKVDAIFSHLCLEERRLAEKYNVLDYFNQDCPAVDSPLVSLAISSAKSARFESPDWRTGDLPETIRAGKILNGLKVYSSKATQEWILSNLIRWLPSGPYRTSRWYEKYREAGGNG